uniref:Putative holin n=1 Tax=viral metagenome TaxID=1070528 RepID=A0A6M3KSC1_9ZZZZ
MGFDITGLGSIFDFGGKIIDKIFPDKDAADKAKLEMFKLQQEGAFKELEANLELAKGQLEINRTEAASPNLFVSGWRPAIGWVCVSAYAFNYLLMPLLNWGAGFITPDAPAILALDTGELTTLLFGMLGIGTLRTFEKMKGVAS